MSDILSKITFNDKEDLINLNSDSKHVLTASNINEIKYVVNDLIDEIISGLLTYDKIFKYIRFNVPSKLTENQFYSLEIELSNDLNFQELNTIQINCYPTLSLRRKFLFFRRR